MDPSHDPEVAYLRLVASARSEVLDYVVHGRLLPAPRTKQVIPVFSQNTTMAGPTLNPGPFPALAMSAWRAADGKSLVVLLATTTHSQIPADFHVDPSLYELAPSAKFEATLIKPSAGGAIQVLGKYDGTQAIPIHVTVPGRDILIVRISPV